MIVSSSFMWGVLLVFHLFVVSHCVKLMGSISGGNRSAFNATPAQRLLNLLHLSSLGVTRDPHGLPKGIHCNCFHSLNASQPLFH